LQQLYTNPSFPSKYYQQSKK